MDSKLAEFIRRLYGILESGAEAYGSANRPMSPEHSGMLGGLLMDFSPLGDVKSAYDGVQSVREGDYLGAALGGLGALPMVPNLAGAIKKIPLEHGTSVLPDGMVRLYHQSTPDAIESISRDGLRLSKAKGIEGPKAIYADEKGFYGKPDDVPTVEFMVPKDQWQQPFVLKDVPHNQIIGTHLPWHRQVRYLLDPANKASLDAALAGKLDKRDGDAAKAVEYVKELMKEGR